MHSVIVLNHCREKSTLGGGERSPTFGYCAVSLRKLLFGDNYHKNSKSNAITLAFILIEFPVIHLIDIPAYDMT